MIEGLPMLPSVASAQAGKSRATLQRELAHATPEEAAAKMEALFATVLVKELRRALPDGFFGKGIGADTFEGWMDEHLGQSLADSGALGLAGQIKVALERKMQVEQAAVETGLAASKPRAGADS